MRPSTSLAAAVCGVMLLTTGCATANGGTGTEDTGAAPVQGPHVVVTTSILGDVVSQILGDAGQVEVLMPPGQDPHGFSPSAQQAALLREADLVVANGLQLEESLLDVLEDAESDGVEVLRVADQLDPLAFEDEHADEDEHVEEHESDHVDDDEHDHGPLDPHVWFDPVRMADGARLIASAVAGVDDTLEDQEWEDRGEEVAGAIEAAHDDIVEILSTVPDECRVMVTNHDALGYFADRYDFEILDTVVPGATTEVDPSAREFAELAELLRETPVPAIFSENTQSTRLADSLVSEVGRDIEVVSLFTDALGEPGSGADTYIGLLTTDAQLVADALADC